MGYKISSGYRTPRSRQRKRDRKSVCDPFYSEAKFFETGIFTSLPKTVFFFATILKCNERQNEKIGILVLIKSSKTVRNLHLLLAKLCESYRDGKTSCHWQCWEKWDFLVKNDPQCMPICQHPPPSPPKEETFWNWFIQQNLFSCHGSQLCPSLCSHFVSLFQTVLNACEKWERHFTGMIRNVHIIIIRWQSKQWKQRTSGACDNLWNSKNKNEKKMLTLTQIIHNCCNTWFFNDLLSNNRLLFDLPRKWHSHFISTMCFRHCHLNSDHSVNWTRQKKQQNVPALEQASKIILRPGSTSQY